MPSICMLPAEMAPMARPSRISGIETCDRCPRSRTARDMPGSAARSRIWTISPSRIARQVSDPRAGTIGNPRLVSGERGGIGNDGRRAQFRAQMDQSAIVFEQHRTRTIELCPRLAADHVEHRLWIAGRGRHRLQHLGSGGLMRGMLAVSAVARSQCRVAFLPQFGVGALKCSDQVVLRRGHVASLMARAGAQRLSADAEGSRSSRVLQLGLGWSTNTVASCRSRAAARVR